MGKYGEFIECIDNELVFDGVKCTDLAKEYGTPLFMISENTLRANFRTFHDAFQSRYPGEVLTTVGLKSNYGLAMRKILATERGAAAQGTAYFRSSVASRADDRPRPVQSGRAGYDAFVFLVDRSDGHDVISIEQTPQQGHIFVLQIRAAGRSLPPFRKTRLFRAGTPSLCQSSFWGQEP